MKLFLTTALLCTAFSLSAFSFWVDAESGAAFTGYNDVRIPADTGTFFSLADDLDPEAVWIYRLQGGIDIGRHSIFGLYAPLIAESTGTIDRDVSYFGEDFAAGTALTGTYKFNSYRLSYAYRFLDYERFRLSAGLTLKIRDAYIQLDDGDTRARRSDLGVVPLINLSLAWDFADPFSLVLRADALAAPQGRAEDVLLALAWQPLEQLELRLGYRLLEGGSDGGGAVYTFSMFHYITAGVRWYF